MMRSITGRMIRATLPGASMLMLMTAPAQAAPMTGRATPVAPPGAAVPATTPADLPATAK